MVRIHADDIVLFGGLLVMAVGAGVIVASSTGDGWLAAGVTLLVFGLPSALVAFLAADEVTAE